MSLPAMSANPVERARIGVPSARLEVATAEADVELVEVSKAFGAFQAVDGISLAIRRGEFFSLLGPSGCGKTTTLRMIGGFEFPDSGEVRIDGRSVTGVPAHRRETNMVFQRLALFPHLSVFDNVAFGLEVKGIPRPEIHSRVVEALEMVQLPGLGGRCLQASYRPGRPHQCSSRFPS